LIDSEYYDLVKSHFLDKVIDKLLADNKTRTKQQKKMMISILECMIL